MNDDEYLKYNTRKEIAICIISKMKDLDAKDAVLTAAMYDFVETGNKDFFQEYMDFHFIKTTEEKAKKLIDTKELEEAINSTIKEADELAKKYNSYVDEYRAYCRKIYNEADRDNIRLRGNTTVANLLKFLSENDTGGNRKLYILVDNKLMTVDSIMLHNNKFVLSHGAEIYNLLPEEPPRMTKIHFDGSVDTWDDGSVEIWHEGEKADS